MWRPVGKQEVEQWRELQREGLTLRQIGRLFGRNHSVVNYHLISQEERRLKCLNRMVNNRKSRVSTLRDILVTAASNARHRAEKKQIAFDIDAQFLMKLYWKQEGKCALTGLPFRFEWEGSRVNPYRPSVDRVTQSQGYVEDNVRLVLTAANLMRREWPDEVFFVVCRAALARWGKNRNGSAF